jgi:hypothetical protein
VRVSPAKGSQKEEESNKVKCLSQNTRETRNFHSRKPRRPWPIITVDWNPCRIDTVQIHPLWPLVPKVSFGRRKLVRGLNPRVTIIFAFSLYSC